MRLHPNVMTIWPVPQVDREGGVRGEEVSVCALTPVRIVTQKSPTLFPQPHPGLRLL